MCLLHNIHIQNIKHKLLIFGYIKENYEINQSHKNIPIVLKHKIQEFCKTLIFENSNIINCSLDLKYYQYLQSNSFMSLFSKINKQWWYKYMNEFLYNGEYKLIFSSETYNININSLSKQCSKRGPKILVISLSNHQTLIIFTIKSFVSENPHCHTLQKDDEYAFILQLNDNNVYSLSPQLGAEFIYGQSNITNFIFKLKLINNKLFPPQDINFVLSSSHINCPLYQCNSSLATIIDLEVYQLTVTNDEYTFFFC